MKNGHVERIANKLSRTELLCGNRFKGALIEDSDTNDRISIKGSYAVPVCAGLNCF
jgi:hypothetical protein